VGAPAPVSGGSKQCARITGSRWQLGSPPFGSKIASCLPRLRH
jgi:hypothetical protein